VTISRPLAGILILAAVIVGIVAGSWLFGVIAAPAVPLG
jgi:hypothetical protein